MQFDRACVIITMSNFIKTYLTPVVFVRECFSPLLTLALIRNTCFVIIWLPVVVFFVCRHTITTAADFLLLLSYFSCTRAHVCVCILSCMSAHHGLLLFFCRTVYKQNN